VIRHLTIFGLLTTALFAQGPRVTIASAPPNPSKYGKITYPWKKHITATVFWIGEQPTQNNPTPNHKSSWDQQWMENFGGYDNPKKSERNGLVPKAFTPKLNPFYIALPYNDCLNWRTHKREASRVIPWFKRINPKPGKTCLKGRWVQIVANKKVCYAQWEDCGPFVTDDYEYGVGNSSTVHWRFIEFAQVPRKGPWAQLGTNNPFKNPEFDPDRQARLRYFDHLRKMRDAAYLKKDVRRSR